MSSIGSGQLASAPLVYKPLDTAPVRSLLKLILDLSPATGFRVTLMTLNSEQSSFMQVGNCDGSPLRSTTISFDRRPIGLIHTYAPSGEVEGIEEILAALVGQAIAAQLNDRNGRIRRHLSVLLAGSRTPQHLSEMNHAQSLLTKYLATIAAASPISRAGIEVLDDVGSALFPLLMSQQAKPAPGEKVVVEPIVIDNQEVARLVLVIPNDSEAITNTYNHRLLRHAASNLGAILSFAASAVNSATRDTRFSVLLNGFDALYAEVYRLLQGSASLDDMLDRVFYKALYIAAEAIPRASIFDVRWTRVTSGAQVLWFRTRHGQAWDQLPTELHERSYPLNRSDRVSKGAKVFKTGEPELVPDVRVDPDYMETFPTVVSMIIAPIRVGSERQGVLDVRSESETLDKLDLEIAVAIGRQLGLIAHLLVSIQGSISARAEVERLQAEQLRAIEDLRHQLLSPISALERRTQRLIAPSGLQKDSTARLFAIRGLARKSYNVAQALRYFVELAKGRPLPLNRVPMSADDVSRILTTSARDAEIVARQPVKIYVDEDSLRLAIIGLIHIDRELLEQAIASVLDNAGKYGFAGSDVDVRADYIPNRDEVTIAVESRGQALRPADVEHCKRRGWRAANQGSSERRSEVAGEGSGIGLWIVEQIMLAHNGRLVIAVDGYHTTVKMCFPAKKR